MFSRCWIVSPLDLPTMSRPSLAYLLRVLATLALDVTRKEEKKMASKIGDYACV